MLFGAHCSGGITGALDRAVGIGADAVQLFAQSPRAWRFPQHAEEDLARFRERRAEAGIGAVLVHALYLCNLATPDEVIHGKSVETMRATVETACALEADGVVFHVGSHLGSGFEAGLAMARTWADFIMYEFEHGPFDPLALYDFHDDALTKVVDHHEGRIWIEDGIDGGTTVRIWLPEGQRGTTS